MAASTGTFITFAKGTRTGAKNAAAKRKSGISLGSTKNPGIKITAEMIVSVTKSLTTLFVTTSGFFEAFGFTMSKRRYMSAYADVAGNTPKNIKTYAASESTAL